jgi:hypothetical protein
MTLGCLEDMGFSVNYDSQYVSNTGDNLNITEPYESDIILESGYYNTNTNELSVTIRNNSVGPTIGFNHSDWRPILEVTKDINEARSFNEHLNSSNPFTINGEVYYFKNLVNMNTEKSIQITSNSNTQYSIEYGEYGINDNIFNTYLKTSPLQKPNDVVTITKVLDLNVFERGKTYVFSVDDCLENALGDTIETNDTFANPTNNFLVWRMPIFSFECIDKESVLNIVNNEGNKYVFNNGSVHNPLLKYGMNIGNYTFNIPINHPMAILNDALSYSPDNTEAIKIYVSGGQSTRPYYTFRNEQFIDITQDILTGDFKFMRRKKYEFIAYNIRYSHPFKIVYNKGISHSNAIRGINNSIIITMPEDDNNDSYYICLNHGDMKHNLSFLYKTVDNKEYNFYYGNINVNVNNNFKEASVYCYYHGYMGGENLLVYNDDCPNETI